MKNFLSFDKFKKLKVIFTKTCWLKLWIINKKYTIINDYIKLKQKEWALNINEFDIGDVCLDIDGSKCEITNKTTNSIEIHIKKKSVNGVDCKQYFEMNKFNKRFKKI